MSIILLLSDIVLLVYTVLEVNQHIIHIETKFFFSILFLIFSELNKFELRNLLTIRIHERISFSG